MGIIKDFKEKECKNIFCTITQLLIFNNLIKIIFLGVCLLTGAVGIGMVESNAIVFKILFGTGLIGLIVFGIIQLIFAFIINPFTNNDSMGR